MHVVPRSNLLSKLGNVFELGSVRYGHHLRGVPPGEGKSLDQKLAELNYKDPSLYYRVDIGLPLKKDTKDKRLEQSKFLRSIRKDVNMEQLHRKQELKIDLMDSFQNWSSTVGPKHIKTIADHYEIFKHLYGDAYFYPTVPIDISFDTDDVKVPVYFGNIISSFKATSKPNVSYECEKDTLWTLMLTNLDGHLTNNDKEYLHWCVGNIPESNIEKGETIVNYLQPFAPKGTGYHRFVFILYKQEKKLDFSSLKSQADNFDLEARSFSTLDFYRNRQDELTPASLAFFQTEWDKTMKDFFHNKLNMKEPIFEYDFDPPYIRPQKWFPLRQPFNLYMDKYRDPKQINKEFLLRKLKTVNPFKDPPTPIPFPNAEPWSKPYIPSWLKLEITKSRLKWGRINDIE